MDEERLSQLVSDLITFYDAIRGLLTKLPVPIKLDAVKNKQGQGWDFVPVVEAVERARVDLVASEPLGETVRKMLASLLLEWLIAYEIISSAAEQGVTAWRVDGATVSMRRIVLVLKDLRDHPDSGHLM